MGGRMKRGTVIHSIGKGRTIRVERRGIISLAVIRPLSCLSMESNFPVLAPEQNYPIADDIARAVERGRFPREFWEAST
jgi:hypothetical protein